MCQQRGLRPHVVPVEAVKAWRQTQFEGSECRDAPILERSACRPHRTAMARGKSDKRIYCAHPSCCTIEAQMPLPNCMRLVALLLKMLRHSRIVKKSVPEQLLQERRQQLLVQWQP